MVSVADLIRLPFTPDLTQAGIEYASRALAYTYDQVGGTGLARLRRIVSGVAVELAFRRHLTSLGVPHETLGATPFTEPDRYDVALGRRRCDLKSFQLFDRKTIQQIHRQPEGLLDAAALVPVDQLLSDQLNDEDLYIFAFATALVTDSREMVHKALQAGQPVYWLQPLPKIWTRPRNWRSLGRLTLRAGAGAEIILEVGGQDAGGIFCQETVRLRPGKEVDLEHNFYTLGYLHPSQLPQNWVGVYSSVLDYPYLVQPGQWGNIWVYGMGVILAGYMARGEFRVRSKELPPDSQEAQYGRKRTKNRHLAVAELYPLGELYERVKVWAQEASQRASAG